jgi:uncharacterized lipoprotein YehR (DUF1307 family)
MRHHIARVLVVSLVLNLSSCGTWIATQTSLQDLKGEKVRLTTTSGKRVAGKLVSDTLGYAVLHRKWWMEDSSVDTTTIAKVEERRFSASRTLLLIPILAVAFAVEMSLIWQADWGD